MSNPKIKPIQALLGFKQLSEGDFASRAAAVATGVFNDPELFANPPIPKAVFDEAVDSYTALKAEALDGGKKAITAKDKQRHVVTGMLRQLATYVEATSNGDLAIFTSSGFRPASTVRVPAQALSPTTIRKIDQGVTGQLLIIIAALVGAVSYDVRYTPIINGTPGAWTVNTLTRVRGPIPVNNLAPGTTYAFQVRVLGKLGFTDWSDSVSRMCI